MWRDDFVKTADAVCGACSAAQECRPVVFLTPHTASYCGVVF